MIVSVQSYSGYKADERPEAIRFKDRVVRIQEVVDQWFSPGAQYFKVKAEDRYTYILKHALGQDVWTLKLMEKS